MGSHLMGIAVNYRLLLELELARVFSVALNPHRAVVIAVELPQYEVVDRSGHLEAQLQELS